MLFTSQLNAQITLLTQSSHQTNPGSAPLLAGTQSELDAPLLTRFAGRASAAANLSVDVDALAIPLTVGRGTVSSATDLGSLAKTSTTSLVSNSAVLETKAWSVSTDTLNTSTGDWFSSNLGDTGLIAATRLAATDSVITRDEMIGILRDSKDDGAIDATELTDLRQVLSGLGSMIPEYVRNLTSKVVNSDPANPRSGIGNLYAGSSATQMENLIGKWFLGSDRPDTSYGGTYREVSGSLFQNGAAVADINQGSPGDCYFLASLGAFASDRPTVISDMFIDNGDGTFTVRFFKGSSAEYVTVDRYLPTYADGTAVNAGWGSGTNTSTSNELWVALVEKAYAQLNESGWIGQDNTNSYAGIDGGWMDAAMSQITGASSSSQRIDWMTQSQLIDLVTSTTIPITAGFIYGGGFGVENRHAYTITSYDSATELFHLNNPWGYQHADVTWDQLNNLNAWIEWSNV